MVNKKILSKVEKYGVLNDAYHELKRKDYSHNEAMNFISKCGILSPNKEQLKPGVSIKKINECLREAKKERRMY